MLQLLLSIIAFVTSALAANIGKATYYGGNLAGGNCMFTDYSLPSGIYGTALAGTNWNTAADCGACLQVTGPNGNSIKVMVMDQCPGCDTNQLDLFSESFSQLESLDAGTIDISWETVACGITSPLLVRNKSGTSKYYFSMQVVNSNNAVTSLQVSIDGGSTWQSTVRKDYDYFEKSDSSGFGTDSFSVKVSCSSGKQITLMNVGCTDSASYTASGNC